MKSFLPKVLLVCLGMLVITPMYAQNQATQNEKLKPIWFENVNEYQNLEVVEISEDEDREGELYPSNDMIPQGEPQHPIEKEVQKENFSTTTTYYNFQYLSYGYHTSIGDLSISPYLYNWGGGYYSYNWQPTTITFAQPAESVTMRVYDYYYYYYHGATIYAYDPSGNYIGSATTNHYGWGNLTFTAPSGQSIGYIVVQNQNNPYWRWYTLGMWVTYGNANTAPVALAQDVTASTDANCEAMVTAAQVDNGSYDPDGDPITLSLSPEGPYALGTTNVTLTVSDGELSSTANAVITVVDDVAPIADLASLADLTGECSVTVSSAPTASDNCAGALVGTTTDPLFYDQQGTYVITWTYDDGNGNTTTQTQNVIVDDVTPPVINVASGQTKLWPPNHKYSSFDVSDFVTGVSDNCSSLGSNDVYITKITSDEPENAPGGGDGNTWDDIVIEGDCQSFKLRKERAGNGNGRVYTVHVELDDGNGNIGTASYQYYCPKNANGSAIDDGVAYEETANCGLKDAGAGTIFTEAMMEMNAYPNPFNNELNVEFSVEQEEYTSIYVYNAMGVKVATLYEGTALAGQHYTAKLDGSDLSKGMYIIRMQSGNDVLKVQKVLLNR